MSIFAIPAWIYLIISVAMFFTTAFAFIDSLQHKPDAYVAADKLTKNTWMIILGLGVAAQMLFWGSGPISLFHLAAIIAAIVYLVDVRPTLRSLTRY